MDGSLAEVLFRIPQELQTAVIKVSNLSHVSPDGKKTWLDIGKTRAELRPSMFTHKLADRLKDLETAQGCDTEFTKKLGARQVLIGKDVVAWIGNNKVMWSEKGLQRYKCPTNRQMVADAVEAS